MLVTTSGAVTIEDLNETLRPQRLCIPIFPLVEGLTLAELVAQNAGGRRKLRYGSIQRYLRAMTVTTGAESSPLVLGGPTHKRATGYGLQRALVGPEPWATYLPKAHLTTLTLSLTPLPQTRRALLLACPNIACALQLATKIMQAGLSLSAFAFLEPEKERRNLQLLLELEDRSAVLLRQTEQIVHLAHQFNTALLAEVEGLGPEAGSLWQAWEMVAAFGAKQRTEAKDLFLDLTLPRANLASFYNQAKRLAQRYQTEIAVWGELGVGEIHVQILAGPLTPEELTQAAIMVYNVAQQLGGRLCTEHGLNPLLHKLWQPEEQQRGLRAGLAKVAVAQTAPALSSLDFLKALTPLVGPEGILTSAEDLACYASDASFAQTEGRPLAVLLPRTTAEVSAVLRLTAQAGWPVVARGAGSGLAGGAIPTGHAVILALTRLQRCTIEPTQALAKVGAGVTTAELQRQAETYGLFYPPDPSSQSVATIGGNLACNAGGPRCLKYGVTSDYVLGLTAVLADGSILKLGDGLAAQGFDAGWVQLLVGSEGTLAVFTEATLRLLPKPAAKQTTLALFSTLAAACTTVEAIMAAGLRPASLELMDAVTIEVVEAYLHLGLPQDAGALLLILNDGEPETVAWETAQVTTLLQQGGAQTIRVAQCPKDEALLWQARRAIGPALARKRPNRLGEDICVPLPQIVQTVQEIGAIARQFALLIPVFGHAGDGNLHPNILFDARDPAEVQRAWQAAAAIFALALNVGGTLSGEHGIGTLKRPFLAQALGPELLALHRTIKKTFDPQGRLNPGKLFP